MGNLSYLTAALGVVWLGIFIYMWMLRRSAQRLADEVRDLLAEEPPSAASFPALRAGEP